MTSIALYCQVVVVQRNVTMYRVHFRRAVIALLRRCCYRLAATVNAHEQLFNNYCAAVTQCRTELFTVILELTNKN